jgi:glycosyltransferase involved in cell wall biosynthesis
MRIACISASRVPSLTANSLQVMKACQAISQLGHEVTLFVPRHHSQGNPSEISNLYGLKSQFPIQWLPSHPSLHRYEFAYLAARKARLLNADIAYVWLLQAGIFSLLAHLPTIIELHGPPEGRFGPSLFRLLQRIPGKKCLLPITHALANQIQQRFNVNIYDQQLVKVSPNGVDLDRYDDLPDSVTAREQLGLPPGLTAGYTGHLYPGRGMSILVHLAIKYPQVSFLWVGGHPPDVKIWRERLAMDKIDNITLAGFVQNSQLPLYQAACDILLMPYEKVITGSSGGNSTTYASPMKMFEYMASRRVILSSDLPVIREVLSPNNAMLCPPEDVDAWSDAFNRLVSNETLRQGLTRQAWLDVQKYNWLDRARHALAGFVPVN